MRATSKKDRRRASLNALTVLALASLLGGVSSKATASETTLRIGYILSRSSQLGAGVGVFEREVSERLRQRYRVEQYPDAMLGGEVAMIKSVQSGALDLVFVTGASLSSIAPAEGVFNIPYLFRDTAQARRTLDGPIGASYLARFDTVGLVGLAWGENGMRQLTNSRRDILAPGDVKGLRLRLPQSDAMTAGFETLGADVRQVPFNQVYGLLKSGTLDAEENPIATIVAARFGQVQDHLTLTAHAYDPAVILMSRQSYDEMSETDRSAMRECARLGGIASREASTQMEAAGLAILQASGMKIVQTVDRAAFVRALQPAVPKWNRMYGADEIAAIRAYAAGQRPQ